ncbi:MAG: DUF3592 domain-containing protein [Ruminococcus sp.]|nr:DUF3592 domain-containing protein [Ruminococcus sp.]
MILGIPIVLFVVLCIAVLITIIGIVYRIYELKYCTEKVEAVCVDIEKEKIKRHGKRNSYIIRPFWEYYYNGRYYRVEGKNANNVVEYRIGEKTTLFINPDKPSQYRAEFFSDAVLTIIAGGIMTLFVLFAILFNSMISV